jgi:hypothetical protein
MYPIPYFLLYPILHNLAGNVISEFHHENRCIDDAKHKSIMNFIKYYVNFENPEMMITFSKEVEQLLGTLASSLSNLKSERSTLCLFNALLIASIRFFFSMIAGLPLLNGYYF